MVITEKTSRNDIKPLANRSDLKYSIKEGSPFKLSTRVSLLRSFDYSFPLSVFRDHLTEFRILLTGFQIHFNSFQILFTGFLVLSTGFWISSSSFQIQFNGF